MNPTIRANLWRLVPLNLAVFCALADAGLLTGNHDGPQPLALTCFTLLGVGGAVCSVLDHPAWAPQATTPRAPSAVYLLLAAFFLLMDLALVSMLPGVIPTTSNRYLPFYTALGFFAAALLAGLASGVVAIARPLRARLGSAAR